MIVEVRDLKKYYGPVKAVDGISFDVKEGEVFSLLGPNGAGKTTTIEILEGIRKKDSGTVKVLGKDVDEMDSSVKRKFRVMFQETPLMENLTVWETIKLFSKVYGVEPSMDVLEKIGLSEKKDSLVRKLSGGQKRRLMFSITLIGDPDLVFLDEPTTGLDPQSRRTVWDVILDMKKHGKTVFLTTHYMGEAQMLSDRICIMDHGKIVEMGTFEEILRRSGLKSVVEYTIDGEVRNEETGEPEKLMKKLIEKGAEKITIRRPNLEDVFLKLTGRSLRD
jgi:ABC-2 type transport system ATP-binding protein